MGFLKNDKIREVQVSKIIAKAWVDAEFRQQLINYPSATLKEVGVEFEDGVEVRIGEDDDGFSEVADGKSTYELTLPLKPEHLTDEEIQSCFEGEDYDDRLIPTSCC